ncbi:MAG: hypothetical protein NTW19_03085 [Planctomycetota bacterium]|nr:hypothetical protein [Planctomycetota bacterium]
MHELIVRDALDACFASWPQQSWIAFRCPKCSAVNHLKVWDGSLAEGDLDGVPGPAFIIKRRLRLDDFHVRARERDIELRSLDLQWTIPAMSAGK